MARKTKRPARKPAAKKAAPKKAAPRATARAAAPARAARKVIVPKDLPKSGVPLSHAVQVGNILYVSGSTPFAGDGSIAKGDFAAQMHQVMSNIQKILAAAGSSLDRVAKVNVILTRISDFWTMNDIYKQYFKEGNYPARTTIEAPLAHPDFLLEIECVAAV
jgi:2-iminobutanoate/2-iminopropanoate deaminase